nr:transposase [Pseudoxanthomonas spadix]
MARLPRIALPGIPQHVVQRGNNRLPCFLDDGDRLRYLQLLRDALHHSGSTLHAYVLMANHVHLLLTPPTVQADAAPGPPLRSLVQWPPWPYRDIWEGRYKAGLVNVKTNCCAAAALSSSTRCARRSPTIRHATAGQAARPTWACGATPRCSPAPGHRHPRQRLPRPARRRANLGRPSVLFYS